MPSQTRNSSHRNRAGGVAAEPNGSSSTKRSRRLVAVVGNPNAGKTTLFNSLTGARQKVGNYPGVTVEKVSSSLKLSDETVECIDVPGLYSLEPVSQDEQVAVDVILGRMQEKPDLLVYVLDAGNIERNLFFFAQLAESGMAMVVALTMTDLLQRRGAQIDISKFANLLGVDVVPVVGHKSRGLEELKAAIERNLDSPQEPNIEFDFPVQVETKVASLRERLARAGLDVSKSQLRKALLAKEGPEQDFEQITGFTEELEQARQELASEGHDSEHVDTRSRYGWAAMVQKAVLQERSGTKTLRASERLDQILTHRVFGLIIFSALMCGVFLSIYSAASPVMDLIDGWFGLAGETVSGWLAGTPILQSLIADGLIAGVGGVIVFLPQILILFFFISVLEGSGYLARAAFLMDRLLGWCGLNGRAFIPLLSSFACAIPGIMSARVMPDTKSRLATILVAPLMSCSARLPVYLLLIGAFIEPRYGAIWAGIALYGMHLVGLVVAIPVALFINRGILKGKRLPFLLELPPYQWPKWKDVWLAMYFRAKTFLQTAGTIIVVMSIVIWALLYFPRSDAAAEEYRQEYVASHTGAEQESIDRYVDGRQLENSFLGRFGKAIEPAFVPAGFDWRLTTSILAAFPARELVVPSLGIIFNLGDEVDDTSTDLRDAVHNAQWPDGRPLLTPWTAVGLMVFFALCCQCMATLATVKRETGGWKWPTFMFVYMTTLAYLAAVGINQLGKLVG